MAVKLTSELMKVVLDTLAEDILLDFENFKNWRENLEHMGDQKAAVAKSGPPPGILVGPVTMVYIGPPEKSNMLQICLGRLPAELGYYNILYRCGRVLKDVDRVYPTVPVLCSNDVFQEVGDGFICSRCSEPVPMPLRDAFKEHNLRLERENDRG